MAKVYVAARNWLYLNLLKNSHSEVRTRTEYAQVDSKCILSNHQAEPKYSHYFPDPSIRCVVLSHLSAQGTTAVCWECAVANTHSLIFLMFVKIFVKLTFLAFLQTTFKFKSFNVSLFPQT